MRESVFRTDAVIYSPTCHCEEDHKARRGNPGVIILFVLQDSAAPKCGLMLFTGDCRATLAMTAERRWSQRLDYHASNLITLL